MNPLELFSRERSPLYWSNLQASEFLVINQGGTQSGKSEAIIRVLFTIAIVAPNYVITVATNTIPKLKEDTLRIALEVATLPEVKPFIKQYHITDRIFTFTNKTTISFKSFENAEQAKGEKRHILYVNEATRISWAIFYELYLRTKVRIFIDYNPTDTFYVHTKIIANPDEFKSIKQIRSWHVHNPYLNQSDRDKIEGISDPDMFKVYARGLTGKLRGMIYTGWDKIISDFPYRDGVIWYVDWATSESKTADELAAGRIKPLPLDLPALDYLVDGLIYARGVSPAEVAQVFKDAGYKEGQPCFCDHDSLSTYELQQHGITGAVHALKGPGSIIAGILYLKRKKMGYTARSQGIELELGKYKWLEIDGIVTNTPVDEYNHQMDGIRMGCHTYALSTGNVA